MKKHIVSALSLALCLGLTVGSTVTVFAEDTKTIDSLKIAFSPYADSDTITTATEPLEDLLKETLLTKGYDVENVDMTVGTSYTAVGQALSAGSADIGFISGGNYVLFSDDCDVLLTALRYGINKDSDDPKDWNDGTVEENTDDMSTYYRSIFLAGPSEKGQALLEKANNGEELTWDDLDSAEEEDVKLFVDHISVICLLYNMFFKKECFAQEQEYRMVFLCVHKREHQVPENSIPVEYRIKDEVFIPFIRMKLGDISCLKSVCVGTKNTSDLAVKGLRHYFGSRNLEVHVRKSEIPLRY
mgnify:CR=1 FL=1